MATALFIGRFQPLHKGHLSAIKQAVNGSDKLIICVGSSQKSNEPENPFSFEERKKMIELSVSGNCKIFPLEDMENNSLWAKQVEKVCGKFDAVYTGNPLVKKLLSEAGHKVFPVKIFPCASATKIREMMADGNSEWKEFVPKPAVKFVEKIGGAERVKNLISQNS